MRFTMDVSDREIHLSTTSIEQNVMRQLVGRLEHEIEEALFGGGMTTQLRLHQMVQTALKDEIAKQVKAAVAARLDEFMEEMLS